MNMCSPHALNIYGVKLNSDMSLEGLKRLHVLLYKLYMYMGRCKEVYEK